MAESGFDGLADLAREESERQTRDAIEAALRSLPEGESGGDVGCVGAGKESDGVCQDCGSEIESARLSLLPGTTQCSACARTRDKFSASPNIN